MCKNSAVLKEPADHAEVPRKSSGSSWWTKASVFLAIVAVGFPCLVSEIIGGWTKQYTSPLTFPFGSLHIPSQANKVVMVTGANTGIGYETALKLAEAGAHVIVACRSEVKGRQAMDRIRKALPGLDVQMTFLPLDLASLESVRESTNKLQRLQLPLDTLVLNAGVMKSPGAEFVAQELTYGFETTRDGLEYHIGVNHVAHFYLTQLVLDSMVPGGRVVVVSSMAERGSYDGGILFDEWIPIQGQMPPSYEDGKAYAQSKLANILFAKELAVRSANKSITVYSCHPGVIQTDLSRYMTPVLESGIQAKPFLERHITTLMGKWFEASMFRAPGGALTQLHLATADPTTLENGAFYHPVGRPEIPSHPQGSNATLQTLLWEETERVIQLLSAKVE
jgi:NAD(P)-dependent dehydrogenase (short-subunit alcohol dehydrogenase family)